MIRNFSQNHSVLIIMNLAKLKILIFTHNSFMLLSPVQLSLVNFISNYVSLIYKVHRTSVYNPNVFQNTLFPFWDSTATVCGIPLLTLKINLSRADGKVGVNRISFQIDYPWILHNKGVKTPTQRWSKPGISFDVKRKVVKRKENN